MKRIPMHLLFALGLTSALLPAASQAWAQYEDREDTTIYVAVYNDEWHYSLWPAHRELALGWNSTGFQGRKSDVLAFIARVWTDMRPLSLRKKMEPTNPCVAAELPPHQCQP